MKTMRSQIITTIIPTFRRPVLLRRAILSVLNQSHENLQIRVYDNASHDETESVVRQLASHDSRIHYHAHSTNIGARANFQYGMDRVATHYFSLFTDDDVLLPDCFATALEGFSNHPRAMFSGGTTIFMMESGQVVNKMPDGWKRMGYFEPPEGLFEMLGRGMQRHIPWAGTVFRREVVGAVERLDLTEGLPSDVDLCLQIGAKFPFYLDPRPCAIYNVHPGNLHQTANLLVRYYGWASVMEKICRNDNLNPEAQRQAKKLARRQLKRLLNNFWMSALLAKNYKKAHMLSDILREEYGHRMSSFLKDLFGRGLARFPELHEYFEKWKALQRGRVPSKSLESSLQKVIADLEAQLEGVSR